MALGTVKPDNKTYSWHLRVVLVAALVAVLFLSVASAAQAEGPEPTVTAEPTATPAQPVTVPHPTYNIFNFPVVGDVLDAVLKGLSDAMRKATQPTFTTLNLILKTPTLASDGDAGPGQLNFYAIVEPLWHLAALPMAGVLGFVLLLYGGVAMQVSAATRSARGIGMGMEGLVATVGGLALAAFSLQTFHLANEAGNVLVDMIMQSPGPGRGVDPAVMASRVMSVANITGPLGSIIVGVILLIPTLLLLMMAVARWALFFVVAVLSPLAAVSLGSAPTKRLAFLWAQMFLFVMLLGPANAILLRSMQSLYDISLKSPGNMEDVPRAVASGAVMFGLLSTAGSLNYAAVQRAFGAALGWVGTGISVALTAVAFVGAAAGAVAAGGGMGALGSSLGGMKGANGNPQGNTALGGQASTAGAFSPGQPAPGGAGRSGGSAQASPVGAFSSQTVTSPDEPGEAGDDTPDGWRERYRAQRREGPRWRSGAGFDWNRAATVGGSLASLAPGPVGRAGVAARLLGMGGMVEDRFSRGVQERDQVKEEAREWWAESDLREQRGLVFGRPSGPVQVERANSIDRAVANVSRKTSDREGLRAGMVGLGRSALSNAVIGGGAYDGIARMGSELGGSEGSRIERATGMHLEAELMSRGTLRGEPLYAIGQSGTARVEIQGAEGIGKSLGLHDGNEWQGSASGQSEQMRQQVLTLVQRLNGVGRLPQGRAYAEELGRQPGLNEGHEAMAELETYVRQAEDGHESFTAGG